MESLASVRFFLLLRGNIESNPGPPKIITVNCRGLSSKCKLLSTIGKLRNETKKNESCLIFLQETHLDDYDLITNAWEGTKVVGSFFSTASRGTLIIMKVLFTINASISDPNGRY